MPPPSAHGQLVARDGGDECWRCGISDDDLVDVAHQLFAHEVKRYTTYKNEPLCVLPTELTHLAHLANLILLCKNCHTVFDASSPSWVMVPEDIDFLINWEVENYEQRVVAGNQGVKIARSVPFASDCPTKLYTAYSVRVTPFLPVPADRFPRLWGGAPTAAVLKSLVGAFQPSVTMPSDIRDKLTRLSNLYSRPTPWVSPDIVAEPKGKAGGSDSGDSGDAGNDDDNEQGGPNNRRGGKSGRKGRGKKVLERSPPRKRTRSSRSAANQTRDTTEWGTTYETPPVSPSFAITRGAPIVPADQEWTWGPQASANDVLKEFGAFRKY